MARFGVEAIRHFGNARANGVSTAEDLTYTFNRSNGFAGELAGAGHTQAFYWADQDCWENDIQDTDLGGDDRSWFDDVDISWIETHGNHTVTARPGCCTTSIAATGGLSRALGASARTGTPSG